MGYLLRPPPQIKIAYRGPSPPLPAFSPLETKINARVGDCDYIGVSIHNRAGGGRDDDDGLLLPNFAVPPEYINLSPLENVRFSA